MKKIKTWPLIDRKAPKTENACFRFCKGTQTKLDRLCKVHDTTRVNIVESLVAWAHDNIKKGKRTAA